MTRLMVIEDDLLYQKLIVKALSSSGYEIVYADGGLEGLALAHAQSPDLIIIDIRTSDLDGFELTRKLRSESDLGRTPILVLTAAAGLLEKLSSLEAGADDYLAKPFEPAELVERVAGLLAATAKLRGPLPEPTPGEQAHLIAVHSLRGGSGCTSLATNLAVGLVTLWGSPTLLMDLNAPVGQVALMLNSPLRRCWSDLMTFPPGRQDKRAFETIISRHVSGLSFIPAGTKAVKGMDGRFLQKAIQTLEGQFDYLVADLPHDFSPLAVKALELAENIVLIVAPDLASVRSAQLALQFYQRLGIPAEKVRLVLNATFPRHGLLKEKIESALSTPVTLTIPYAPDLFVSAINYGQPLIFWKPEEPVSGLLEDLCFFLSREDQKKSRPGNPTEAWRRVYKRYQHKRS